MRLYTDLADWYPLLTPLEDYIEEAPLYREVLLGALGPAGAGAGGNERQGRPRLLELGAGAGHNAYYLQDDFQLTLTDLSPEMLQMAARNCPGAVVSAGDMRTLRLGTTFDAVFMHDAIVYMIGEADLRASLTTAHAHLVKGGVLLVAPDHVSETFEPSTETGGSDGVGPDGQPRALRYLEWSWQEPGVFNQYVTDYTLVMREGSAEPTLINDRHREGLFPRDTWRRLLEQVGFSVEAVERPNPDGKRVLDLFLCRRL